MRVAISGLLGMGLTTSAAIAFAQPPPPAPPPPAPAAQPSDIPPPPPAPGSDAPPAAPAALPPAFPAEPSSLEGEPPLAGWHGSFFLRDRKDYFRIYPKLRLMLDFTAPFGPSVTKVAAADGGNGLKARFFVRRLEVEMGGEFLKRFTFNGGFEVTQPLSNTNGKAQLSASGAGVTPTADTARFQPVQATAAGIQAADVWIDFRVAPWINIMLGQFNAPFSMENRTGNKITPFMERNVAIRGFVMPSNKEIGLTLWGEVADKLFNYEIGVFGGDGQNRPQVDNSVDFMGRIFVKPFAGSKGSILQKAQIGLSARQGARDPRYVGYDYAPITAATGATLWSPGYKDSLGRNIHILPSGAQRAIGGELRLPIEMVEIRGEAYYVANNTREAVEGFQLTNTERFGQIKGLGWYVQGSWWLGDRYVSGDPGMVRPTRIDLAKEPEPPKKGLEILALFAGVNAAYDGASRVASGVKSTYDAKTPGNPSGKNASSITLYQFSLGLNYWHSSYIRSTLNYSVYHTPSSGTADNAAIVPGDTAKPAPMDPKDFPHLFYELGARVAIAF